MTYFYRHGLSPAGFTAILSSPVIADWWWLSQPLTNVQPSAARSMAPWPPLYLAVAQTCAEGQPILGLPWAQRFQALASVSPEAVLLVATPVLLLQVNRYGHRQANIQGWASDLGLSPALSTTLATYFHSLCQALTGQIPSLSQHPGKEYEFLALAAESLAGSLRPLQALVQAAQGQFLLALELAHSRGYAGPAISWVGLLASLVVGLPGLPLALWGNGWSSSLVAERWQGHDTEHLQQLAEALYRRWAGVGYGALPNPQTAYNS
ncbi:MAG: hypothetical protein HC929_08625 [Leptolyngbyaceae cyanobacterium SM2_5_2]|nr:hypothetical protein [Leptolyngbyaceae cyanobacterium SM2_5_2]